jgi:hypothetical protein
VLPGLISGIRVPRTRARRPRPLTAPAEMDSPSAPGLGHAEGAAVNVRYGSITGDRVDAAGVESAILNVGAADDLGHAGRRSSWRGRPGSRG